MFVLKPIKPVLWKRFVSFQTLLILRSLVSRSHQRPTIIRLFSQRNRYYKNRAKQCWRKTEQTSSLKFPTIMKKNAKQLRSMEISRCGQEVFRLAGDHLSWNPSWNVSKIPPKITLYCHSSHSMPLHHHYKGKCLDKSSEAIFHGLDFRL